MTYPCGKCEINVLGNSICCDNCDKWHHLECTYLSKKEFSKLSKNDTKWYCSACNTCDHCKK